eukprot:jgi/Botrbrau1/16555/Bobra.176_2s0004.1
MVLTWARSAEDTGVFAFKTEFFPRRFFNAQQGCSYHLRRTFAVLKSMKGSMGAGGSPWGALGPGADPPALRICGHACPHTLATPEPFGGPRPGASLI